LDPIGPKPELAALSQTSQLTFPFANLTGIVVGFKRLNARDQNQGLGVVQSAFFCQCVNAPRNHRIVRKSRIVELHPGFLPPL